MQESQILSNFNLLQLWSLNENAFQTQHSPRCIKTSLRRRCFGGRLKQHATSTRVEQQLIELSEAGNKIQFPLFMNCYWLSHSSRGCTWNPPITHTKPFIALHNSNYEHVYMIISISAPSTNSTTAINSFDKLLNSKRSTVDKHRIHFKEMETQLLSRVSR